MGYYLCYHDDMMETKPKCGGGGALTFNTTRLGGQKRHDSGKGKMV